MVSPLKEMEPPIMNPNRAIFLDTVYCYVLMYRYTWLSHLFIIFFTRTDSLNMTNGFTKCKIEKPKYHVYYLSIDLNLSSFIHYMFVHCLSKQCSINQQQKKERKKVQRMADVHAHAYTHTHTYVWEIWSFQPLGYAIFAYKSRY